MTYFNPATYVPGKKELKKQSEPRAETLMLIRHFARTYELEHEQNRKDCKSMIN